MKISDKVIKKMSAFAREKQPFFFIIDFDGTNSQVLTPLEATTAGIYYNINGQTNYHEQLSSFREQSKPANSETDLIEIFPVPFQKYDEAFNEVQLALQRGDTYLLNLTFKTKIGLKLTLDEIFVKSKARYKLYYNGKFVVFSPEMFIRINGRTIETRPMKGTISADFPEAEKMLMENRKEIFEHNTIVDLLRNDLNIVAKNVTVENFRYVEKIHKHNGDLLQVSSIIKGELPNGFEFNLGEIIAALLPAGSVTGAPKERTVQIIKEIENYDRGFYTGIFGFYDGHILDAAVSIRFIEKDGENFYFKSGGGITALSKAEDEYQELLKKIYVPIL